MRENTWVASEMRESFDLWNRPSELEELGRSSGVTFCHLQGEYMWVRVSLCECVWARVCVCFASEYVCVNVWWCVIVYDDSDSGSSNILKERARSLDRLQLWTTNLDCYVSQWVLFMQKPLSCELIQHTPSAFVFSFNWNLYGKNWKWA